MGVSHCIQDSKSMITNGIKSVSGISRTALLCSQSGLLPLGLYDGNALFPLAVSLGLPDPTGWVKTQVFDFAFPQVIAFSTACLGCIAVLYLIKAFRS